MRAHQAHLWRWLERGLFAFGVACLAWCTFVIGEAAWWQSEHRRTLQQAPHIPAPPDTESEAGRPPIHPGDPIGEIEVPRLHLSAVMVEGDDDSSLKLAVGHLTRAANVRFGCRSRSQP